MKKSFFSLMMVAVLVLSACMSIPTAIATKEIPTFTLLSPTATAIPATPTPEGKTLLVTSPADSGPGTLRQAMLDAQNGDTITFDPAFFLPNVPETIAIESELPWLIQGHLTIDASNAGVILDGNKLPQDSWIPGIAIDSENNTIQGLQIVNFTGAGIALYEHPSDNVIGGDRDIGSGPIGQGNLSGANMDGIGVMGATDNIITGNIWNEPNDTPCPQGIEVADHTELARRMVRAVREANPAAKIVVGAVTWLHAPVSQDYLLALLTSDVMSMVDGIRGDG